MIKIRFGDISPSGAGYKGCYWFTDLKEAYEAAITYCKSYSIYVSVNNRKYVKKDISYIESFLK